MLVLEAGRTDSWWDLYIHMPAAFSFPIGNRFYDWKYESEPEPFMNGRRIYHARGKVLGGSSSINGMIFQRGNPLDFERWGLEDWDYAHCLPYFKRMETCLAGADEWRGGDGPLLLERGPADGPLFACVPRRGAGGGLRADRRRERLPAGRALRGSTATSTAAAAGAPRARTSIRRCRGRTSRCGRAPSSSGSSSRARAPSGCRSAAETIRAGEVILCGGAINSPQLLQLSGVGNAARARARSGSTSCTTCPASARTCRTISRSTCSARRSCR